ncbi:TetR/AcrR family transcriptional regulator [Paucisalibacillus sp. EB02]|uniref:TetR/AcrR family transcriptional regulator n=1 Tax=Paucisalibacillus sp. EB02 TaxID=1347087 RepID=UPI0004AF8C5E|nr:TetR/AcrR family transcriptional regulator [Paucisalibacillus sp. EB02]
MPRGFNANEKEFIRDKLLSAARELFSSLGLKKTSIKDLTGKAGIAQGTFYNFFESKEVIYFLLLEQDEKEIKQNVINKLMSKEITPSNFANVIYTTVKQIENYPLIRRLYTTEEYELLVRKLPNELLKEHSENDILSLNPLLDQWKNKGEVDANLSNEVVTSALRALFLMTIHKREIGEDVYDQSLQFLAEGIALRLFKGGENT